ncbi:MAG: hypothetical protein ACTSVM_01060 [Candidatus Ranarchaeia archaeon]
MPSCPECAGNMKFDPSVRCYVCQRCGLALTRDELDKAREKFRGQLYDRSIDEADRRKREYLDWWLKEKK